MKQLLLIAGLFCVLSSYAQNKTTIDSLNALLIQNASVSTDSLFMIYQKNLQDALEINYERGIAGSYEQLSGIFGYRGEYDKSTAAALKSIRYYLKVNDLEKVSDYYGSLGYSMKKNNIDTAQYYMNKGLKIAEEHQFEWVLSRTYNNYGVIKEMKNQLDSAEYFYRKGLEIVQKPEFREGLPYSYSNLAGIFGLKNMPDSAFYYFNKSLDYRRSIGDKKGMAENFTQIGEVYLADGKNQEAIQYFKRSIPLAKKEDYRFLTQYTYQQISQAFKNLKNTDSALLYYEKYATYKDSLTDQEMQTKIAQLNVEYETELKENEILAQQKDILEKDNKIQRRNFWVFGLVGGLILLALLSYFIYSKLKLKHRQLKQEKELEIALTKLETSNKLEEQRLRISRDLHDNIGSQLTFIISSLDNLKYSMAKTNAAYTSKIDEIGFFTATTINELRDTIWAMNKEKISLKELKERIQQLFEKANSTQQELYFQLNIDDRIPESYEFSSLVGINIYRIIQEALNNSMKYSEAKNFHLNIRSKNDKLIFEMKDDGIGYNPDEIQKGNGFYNMKKRARDINLESTFESEIGKGSRIILVK